MQYSAKKNHNHPRLSSHPAIRLFSFISAIMILFSASSQSVYALEKKMLIPGGITFGARLSYPGVMIVELWDDPSCPAKQAGLKTKDLILAVNGERVSTAEDLSEKISSSRGNTVTLTYERNGKENSINIDPIRQENQYRLGVTVRDSAAGIGTVTYIVPETGGFGGLGHGICNKESGELAPFAEGSVCQVDIKSVKKGTSGCPGEIRGAFTAKREGSMTSNTTAGVFGLYACIPQAACRDAIEAADPKELKLGKATIISTLGNDGAIEYDVEITGIFEPRANSEKGFSLKVTDSRLLERTGGIVQGMSGSPVIQNGKLVGAVTHVLVNDPTSGYGIFISTMLDAMPDMLLP